MNIFKKKSEICIIGGGFFGCALAVHLSKKGHKVVICEAENDLMTRASYNNQARVHNGYHYPRSLLTALRSRKNLPLFVKQYENSVVRNFAKLYAIPKFLSKVSALQFKTFCERIGADLKPADEKSKKLFNSDLIEEVFEVQEYAFDSVKLRNILIEEIKLLDIDVRIVTKVVRVVSDDSSKLIICCEKNFDKQNEFLVGHVFNCTYSQLNQTAQFANAPQVPLKHELTEMGLVQVPEELNKVGITVMCGPFFSCMPFPAQSLHSISHVRYTPHAHWYDKDRKLAPSIKALLQDRKTQVPLMIADAARYVPVLKNAEYKSSLWEVKTVLQSSEADDSRPIFFKKHHGMLNFHSVLGGKIDNIFDLIEEIDGMEEELQA